MLIFDPRVPGSREAAIEEFQTHNRAVEERLRDRGLNPHGQAQSLCDPIRSYVRG